jgi:hypothetical protein
MTDAAVAADDDEPHAAHMTAAAACRIWLTYRPWLLLPQAAA